MGQRLTVDILENGERIALVYYHWSAYFDSAIWKLKQLKDYITKAKKEKHDVLLGIIEGLEATGGGIGITPINVQAAKALFPSHEYKENVNRNDGLIYVESNEIKRVYGMSEGTASIDISTEEVINDVDLEFRFHFNVNMFPANPFDVMTFDQLESVYDRIIKIEESKRSDHNVVGQSD